MDVDHTLDAIGGYGLFQKRNSLLLGLIIFVFTFQTLVMVFMGAEPDWKCSERSVACNRNGTFDTTHEFYSARCRMNRSDWKFTKPFTSIVTEWDLVCDQATYASLAQSIFFLGWIPGALIAGRVSDRFGRTRIMFPSVAVVAIFAFISSFAHSLWLFLVMRAVIGFFEGGVFAILYVLTTEFVGPKQRGLAGTLVWVFFSLSLMVLAGLAYAIRHWRLLSIVVSAPALPLVVFWCWVPESVRWLLVHNKETKAKRIFGDIAKLNNKELPEEQLVINADERMPSEHEGGVLDLFWPKEQLFKSLILWLTWFTNALVYYGVTLSVGFLGGSIYLNFFLTGLIEVPSNMFAIWFMNLNKKVLCQTFYGRKRALVVCLLLASLFCILVSTIPPSDTDAANIAGRVIFAILGKFCINVSFSTIYVFSSELLPTVIRNVGLGSMQMFDQAGAAIAPFVVLLDKQHPTVPFAVMAVCSLIAGFLSCLLPETLGQPTLETLNDARKAQLNAGRLQSTQGGAYRKSSTSDSGPSIPEKSI